jgi:hypothetical protein
MSELNLDALYEQVAQKNLPFYVLVYPRPRRRWVAAVSGQGIGFAYLTEGPELEIEVGYQPRSRTVKVDSSQIRLNLARDLTLSALYPAEGAADRGRDWWDDLVSVANADATALATDPGRWQETTLSIDETEIRAWCTHVSRSWILYCEHGPSYVYVKGQEDKTNDLRIKSCPATALRKYILGLDAPPKVETD